MSIRIATFNVENLMARFDFSGWRNEPRRDRTIGLMDVANEKQYRHLEQARVIAHADDARQMTALALAQCNADIVCLQEVENLDALDAFERNYLTRISGFSYPQKVWIEGNDGRGIDVALMARDRTALGQEIVIERTKSHRKETFASLNVHTKRLAEMGFEADERLFRRDCLEVDLRIGGRWLSLFICHFKSMGPFRDGMTGRDYTMPMRLAEARGVRRIIRRKFGSERVPEMRWMVVGDLNDYPGRLVVGGNAADGFDHSWKDEKISGMDPLLMDGFASDLSARRPQDDRWTLYHAAGGVPDLTRPQERETRHLVQLDYLLASPALAAGNEAAVPEIVRNGQPYRTPFPPHQNVERYPRTGWDRPKASDHCPVAVSLELS